jgi:hypothetical protein
MSYTNSPLVAYTKLSPNNSGQRTKEIDRITPHCTVGQVTAEGLGDWFSKTSTKASSNYGIDRNGRVGLYVEEKNRSWCSSNAANDQRAVTIECASDTKEPYEMNTAVYETLVKLCTDICERNGKKKLLWLGDKEKTLKYKPQPDEMVLTVHRWFANKSCPGDWLYSRLGDLAEKVTAALGSVAVSDTASGTDDVKTIWDYLYGKLGNACGAAGLMGNLYAESSLKSAILQRTYEKKLNITSEEYTRLVDGGNYPDFVKDKAGYGLAQWTFWSRKEALLSFARTRGSSIGDLSMQLDFLWKELTESYPAVLTVLKGTETVREASDAVLLWYERPADQSEAVMAKRASYGQGFYDKYAAKEMKPAPARIAPYLVKVGIPDLNIRKGPGVGYARTGKFTGVGTFTIVEEQDGWGKLKSGAGWICLKYTSGI